MFVRGIATFFGKSSPSVVLGNLLTQHSRSIEYSKSWHSG